MVRHASPLNTAALDTLYTGIHPYQSLYIQLH